MKKIIAVILAAVMALTFAACTTQPADEPSSLPAENPSESAAEPSSLPAENADILADGVFTVGFDQNFPPYGFVGDDGEFAGFDLDVARKVAEKNGWEIALTPINWDTKDLELSSGAIDCIWNGFTMNGREKEYTFSAPYMDNSQVVVVKADSGIANLEGLAGKTVSVQIDSSAEAALNSEELAALKTSFGSLVNCPEYNTAFMDLEAGAVDAVAMDAGVAKFQIEGKEDKFVILEETLVPEQYGIGFKLGNTALCEAVQKTYDELFAEGFIQEMADKYGVSDGLIAR